MKSMFYGCKSLKDFPNISKWNTKNVINMEKMFYGCESLESFPDISEWNIQKVKDMNNIFDNCLKLKSVPKFKKSFSSKIKSFTKTAFKVGSFLKELISSNNSDDDIDSYNSSFSSGTSSD